MESAMAPEMYISWLFQTENEYQIKWREIINLATYCSMTLQPSQPLPGIFYLSNTRVGVFPIASHPLEGSSCAAVLYNEVRRGACCHNRPPLYKRDSDF